MIEIVELLLFLEGGERFGMVAGRGCKLDVVGQVDVMIDILRVLSLFVKRETVREDIYIYIYIYIYTERERQTDRDRDRDKEESKVEKRESQRGGGWREGEKDPKDKRRDNAREKDKEIIYTENIHRNRKRVREDEKP